MRERLTEDSFIGRNGDIISYANATNLGMSETGSGCGDGDPFSGAEAVWTWWDRPHFVHQFDGTVALICFLLTE